MKLTFALLGLIFLAQCSAPDPDPATPDADAAVPAEETQLGDAQAAPETAPDPSSVEAAMPELSPEFSDLSSPYREASYAIGRRIFRQCSSCHLVEAEAGHLVGPNLHGIFGRQVGAKEGFTYSKALQEADFIWTPEKLDDWLTNPRSFLPGNRMSFVGVRRPSDREAVIAYLLVNTTASEG